MRKREYHPDEYHPFPTPRPFHPKNSRQLFDIPVYTGSQPPIIKEARSPKPRVELTAKSRFSSWSTFIEKQYRHKFLLGQEIPTDREPPSLSLSLLSYLPDKEIETNDRTDAFSGSGSALPTITSRRFFVACVCTARSESPTIYLSPTCAQPAAHLLMLHALLIENRSSLLPARGPLLRVPVRAISPPIV